MAVSRPCYCTREMCKSAPDFKPTSEGNRRVDRAIESASDLIEEYAHRVFYPNDTALSFDWPNYSYAPSWTLRFNQWDLISATAVESPPGTAIPLASVILRPTNRKPNWPYTGLELNRSTTAAFSAGSTPQNSIKVTGTWGFTAATDPAGALAAAISDTIGTAVTVSDGSVLGVGDIAIVDSERMLVTETATATTGQTNVSGLTTSADNDVACTVTDGTKVHLGEVLLIDQERLKVTDVTGNVATVIRGWDGTSPATHAGGTTVYAYRLLTVLRGQLGTTAATHNNGAVVSRHRPPPLIRDLCVAEALNQVLQEVSGYSRTVGEGDMVQAAPGTALAEKWAEAMATYGRHGRMRTV